MTRPKITLHIFTSMDGKITGSFANAPECKPAAELFKAIGFQENHPASFHFQGWLYGSSTGEEFTNHAKPELKEVTADVPKGDHIINLGKEKYFIAFNRTGKLGWQENTTSYADVEAHVLEILTEQVTDQYKAFLIEKEIPYLIAGAETIDLGLALDKLATIYGLDNLLLGGGGVLNWSFLEAGLVDEVSLIVAPAVDGDPQDTALFNSRFTGNPGPIGFTLNSAEVLDGGTLWLRYRPNN
ncbi:dihydrofolate reductase family protein [Enterococcus sp. 669A]|uniref:Dihydrofolate reductase family protein n=1 Tax=Candidatus Enterococcus moelleringii TaxID=2815325 RepID=A0ABS3LCN2_9ENTE|nr:dihydrofolate reductase family protein [Enterococcus sp. 669A]MBO1307393.1 dihydrofolate reductase family protein [Enterococcus sp. 669A]